MHAHGLLGGVADFLGMLLLFGEPLLDGPAGRQVAMHGVVGAGLVGDGIGAHAAFDQPGQEFGGVAEQCDRFGFAGLGVLVDAGERVVAVGGLFVDVAGAQAQVDVLLLAFAVEGGSEENPAAI